MILVQPMSLIWKVLALMLLFGAEITHGSFWLVARVVASKISTYSQLFDIFLVIVLFTSFLTLFNEHLAWHAAILWPFNCIEYKDLGDRGCSSRC